MASMQCYKTVEQTCNQGQYYDSSMVGFPHKTHAQPSLVNTQTQCTTKTQAYYGQTQTTYANNPYGYSNSHTHTRTHSSNGMTAESGCNNRMMMRKRSEHKRRGLFQKLKDGISGGDSSCSSSDSESDDENCGRRRPSHC